MYLDAVVSVPEAPGKITFHAKGSTTYVEFECERVYIKDKKYTEVKKKTIGKYSK